MFTASSTTELRPARSSSDLSQWSVDDVARYIADADSALSPYSDLFRKHVGSTLSVLFIAHCFTCDFNSEIILFDGVLGQVHIQQYEAADVHELHTGQGKLVKVREFEWSGKDQGEIFFWKSQGK